MYLLFLERQDLQIHLFLGVSCFHGNLGYSPVVVISYSKAAACMEVKEAEHVLMIIPGIRGDFAP